jgi:hypothetical protein
MKAKISKRVEELGDWRPATLERVRQLIHEADPGIVEERKWKKPSNPAGVPVFSREGIVCTGETHKQVVKLTFARGASLDDPKQLFNSSLEGNVRRAIDLREGTTIDEAGGKCMCKCKCRSRSPAGMTTGKPRPTARVTAGAKQEPSRISTGRALVVSL